MHRLIYCKKNPTTNDIMSVTNFVNSTHSSRIKLKKMSLHYFSHRYDIKHKTYMWFKAILRQVCLYRYYISTS